MLSRRNMLKGIGGIGAIGSLFTFTDVAIANSDVAIYVDTVDEYANKIEKSGLGCVFPPPVNIPFATLPINYYIRVPHKVFDNVTSPEALWPLVKQLKAYKSFDVVEEIGRQLWDRWRPKGAGYKQVAELDTSMKALVKTPFGNDVYANGAKIVQHNKALVERTCTPSCVIDLMEMYPHHLAIMLCSLKEMSKNFADKVDTAIKYMENGYSSWELEYTPIVTETTRKNHIFEFSASCLVAGIVHP